MEPGAASPAQDQSLERRSANYKPNIWKYDLLQSLTSEYTEESYERQANTMKEEIKCMFGEEMNHLGKLELIDSIEKLGLSIFFEEEIRDYLGILMMSIKEHQPKINEDLHASALCFRLLRQHGYHVSQDTFINFTDDINKFNTETTDVMAMLELFEASHVACEDENILEQAKQTCAETLRNVVRLNIDDLRLANLLDNALKLPLQWRVEWYDVGRHISDYEQQNHTKPALLKLAKLNFNMVQATHQKDLKDLLRWWRNLDVKDNLSFTRDRMVECYLWAVGVAFEPKYRSLRNWLSKAIKLVLIIDDLYDVYASFQELQRFTDAVERWDSSDIQDLPECIKICFQIMYKTVSEVASDIEREKGWISVLPHLHKVWAGFCKALFVEARWYNTGYTPSLEEYLENGWVSSSGPILSLHAFFSAITTQTVEEAMDLLEISCCQELVHSTSLIIRLCNDRGTSTAELERGDAPSSILCYMREANVSEETAREHVNDMILDTWKKINTQGSAAAAVSPLLQPFIKLTTNTARVAHFIYQNGDGFGVQDRETRDHVLSLLIHPL